MCAFEQIPRYVFHKEHKNMYHKHWGQRNDSYVYKPQTKGLFSHSYTNKGKSDMRIF